MTPDRPLHVAVFCTSLVQATELMEGHRRETGRRGERVVIVKEPLKDHRGTKAAEQKHLLPRAVQTSANTSSQEATLNHLCHSAWKAISGDHKGLSMLVNYAESDHSDSPASVTDQICQTESLVNYFLPNWSFGFPLARFCLYFLPQLDPLDLKKLILTHRHILFPNASTMRKKSLTEDLLERPGQPPSNQPSLLKTLQNHIALTALGAVHTPFTFLSPTGKVPSIAWNLREFVERLPKLPQDTFNHHLLRWVPDTFDGKPLSNPALRSDFALWLAYSLHDCPLAMDVFNLVHRRTRGHDLSELSLFGQQMLRQAVTRTCARRLLFLENHLARTFELASTNEPLPFYHPLQGVVNGR